MPWCRLTMLPLLEVLSHEWNDGITDPVPSFGWQGRLPHEGWDVDRRGSELSIGVVSRVGSRTRNRYILGAAEPALFEE
jgi:hypothetical protein